jgi:hypothetical protein
MLVCDDVDREPNPRPNVNILGMTHTIRPKPGQGFPLPHSGLCVYLVLTGGVGTGAIQIRVVEADTGLELFGSPTHRVSYPNDRHDVSAVIFRIRRCVFPRPGLYWVEFHHDGIVAGREPLIVREA